MDIEKIFRKIPMFSNISLDITLFESKYPVMFTCKNGKEIFLFIRCTVNADIVEWIGTKTSYNTLINLLENRVTIRDAFLDVTNKKYLIQYNGKKTFCNTVAADELSDELLPTAGEYMDAEEDEFSEEIETFKTRLKTIDYKIQPCVNNLLYLSPSKRSIKITDDYYIIPKMDYEVSLNIKKIANFRVRYA